MCLNLLVDLVNTRFRPIRLGSILRTNMTQKTPLNIDRTLKKLHLKFESKIEPLSKTLAVSDTSLDEIFIFFKTLAKRLYKLEHFSFQITKYSLKYLFQS